MMHQSRYRSRLVNPLHQLYVCTTHIERVICIYWKVIYLPVLDPLKTRGYRMEQEYHAIIEQIDDIILYALVHHRM